MSGSRNGGSSLEDEDSEVESIDFWFFVVPNGGSLVGVSEKWWWLTCW